MMFFLGKSTISMAIFNSKLLVYQRVRLPNFDLSPLATRKRILHFLGSTPPDSWVGCPVGPLFGGVLTVTAQLTMLNVIFLTLYIYIHTVITP